MRTILALIVIILSQIPANGNRSVPHTITACMTDTTKNVELKEAAVIASRVTKKADRDVYQVRSKDVRQAEDVLSLIGMLPGIRYQALDEGLKVHNSSKIAYQVNGMDKTKEQVAAYPPGSIKSIEVIHSPSGRYQAEDIEYVINLILKDDYKGLDLNIRNFTIVSPGKNNGNNHLVNEQPRAALQYLTRKWSISTSYTFGDIHWNYPMDYRKELFGKTTLETVPGSSGNPNEHNYTQAHAARFGFDFTPNSRHRFSFNSSYAHQRERKDILYRLTKTVRKDDISTQDDMTEESRTSDRSNDWRSSLSYYGRLPREWRLNAGLNYNRLASSPDRFYRWGNNPPALSDYRHRKDYVSQYLSAEHMSAQQWFIDFGTANTFNRYTTRNERTGKEERQSSFRSRLFFHATKHWREDFSTKIGIGGEYIKAEGKENTALQPDISLNYHPQGIFSAQIGYTVRSSYPKQYQLAPETHQEDSVTVFQGNPGLRPLSQNHELTATFSFWDNLVLAAYFSYAPKSIQPYYRMEQSGTLISTFTNAKLLQNIYSLEYTWAIGERWSWYNAFRLNHYKVNAPSMKGKATSWGLTSELQYYVPGQNLMFTATYDRGMVRIPDMQGFHDTGQDLWQFAIQKQAFKKRLTVSFIYLPPIHTGIRHRQKQEIITPFYRTSQGLHLSTYDNMLFLRITWRMHKGKKTKEVIDQTTYDDEKAAGRGLM